MYINNCSYKRQGIFTDGDLRRVLETLALNSNSLEGQQNIQDITIGAVMTKNCKSISADKPAMAAVAMMDEFKVFITLLTKVSKRLPSAPLG
jgi:arabinose-5-phosphate isomerase